MRCARIADVTSEPGTWNPQASASDHVFRYIDISSIDSAEKRIVTVATIAPSEAPSRARQLVRNGDVLVSTVRPNLNAVALVPEELNGATASTGFAVLRPDAAQLDTMYLYHWVRSPQFVSEMSARASGASYPAVTEFVVRNSKLPLPSLAEQRRIARLLDTVNDVQARQTKTLSIFDELARSAFLSFFGDPFVNERAWTTVRLADLASDVQYGTSTKANSDGRGLPVLRMNNLTTSGEINLTDMKWCEVEEHDISKYSVRPGDLLFNRTNSPELVGKTAVWQGEGSLAFAGYLVRVRFVESRVSPHFVSACLNSASGKHLLFNKAKSSNNMSNISASELMRISIPVPPLELQHEYDRLRIAVTRVSQRTRLAASEARNLMAALVQRELRRATDE